MRGDRAIFLAASTRLSVLARLGAGGPRLAARDDPIVSPPLPIPSPQGGRGEQTDRAIPRCNGRETVIILLTRRECSASRAGLTLPAHDIFIDRELLHPDRPARMEAARGDAALRPPAP